jgi:transcription elongation factor GreA
MLTAADDGVIEIGSRVRVRYSDAEDDDEFVLASPEMEGGRDRLSVSAPLGQALLGRRVGDHARFRAPGGICGVTVVGIHPSE